MWRVEFNAMSGYDHVLSTRQRKNAFAALGILCFAGLMLPPAIYAKYAFIDRPREQSIARNASPETIRLALAHPEPQYELLYENLSLARQDDSANGMLAIQALAQSVLLHHAQVFHPVECFRAKLQLSSLSSPSNTNPLLRKQAAAAMIRVAAAGAIISR
jgi:hypothetical protein